MFLDLDKKIKDFIVVHLPNILGLSFVSRLSNLRRKKPQTSKYLRIRIYRIKIP